MSRHAACIAVLLLGVTAPWHPLRAQTTPSAPSLDVLHLENGSVLTGKILRLATPGISMQVQLPGVTGTAMRDIALDQVKFIDFAPLPGEQEALAAPHTASSQARLLELWRDKSVNLRWKAGNAGQIGLVYAGELMKQTDPALLDRALHIYELVEREDWDPARRDEGKKGRLRALIALKRIDAAIQEAQQLAQKSEDPSLLLEARQVLAMAEFEKLKAYERDHPRWMEDEDLTAERTRLYHSTLDQLLYAPLNHGSVEDKAAEALWSVVQVHQFANEPMAALERARDLLELYPSAPQAVQARAMLDAMKAVK